MSKSSQQDYVFVPPVETADLPEQHGSEDGNAWENEASTAYAKPQKEAETIHLRDVNDSNRTVSDEQIPGVNSFTVHALEMFSSLDADKSGGISRAELESAHSSGRYHGQDTQVMAGLMDRGSWDRMVNFVKDNKDELTRDDLWEIGVKYNNGVYRSDTQRQRDDIQAILTAFELAQTKFESQETR